MSLSNLLRRRTILHLAIMLALTLAWLPFARPVQAVSPNVVISQVYGGGGNSGAVYTNDFVELFNRGTTTVSLDGWSVQYTSATGTGNFGATSALLTPLSGSLFPGQYLLIQEASGGSVGVPLPTPDVTDSTPINMSATGGKVALVNTATPLGCNGGSTPCSADQLAHIVDLVGWDGANFYEGSGPAPSTSNSTAVLRANAGCIDTDNNAADFSAGTPTPRNSTSPLHSCVSTNPTGVGTADPDMVPAGENTLLTVTVTPGTQPASTGLTVSADLSAIGGSSSQAFYDDGTHGDAAAGDNVFSYLASTPANLSNCNLSLAASIRDEQSRTGSARIALAVGRSAAIHDVQGASHISPLKSACVVNVAGIVTAKTSNGYYFEDPNPDGDPATSEGVFVFTSSAPSVNVGDALLVSGTVSEFRPGGTSSTNLTTTELSGPKSRLVSSGNPLPAPVVIGAGGRIPPDQVIENDASGDVENSGIFDPNQDGIDFYESLEGMLVQVNDAVAVGPTSVFGGATPNNEIPVVGDNGANAGLLTPRGGIVVRPDDFNPERIILNDLIAGGPDLPLVNVGDRFPGAIVGVMDYSFGNFKLQVTQLPAVVSGGLQRETAGEPGPGQLSVATFNVENLAPTDPPAKFATLAGLIVNNLKAPDLLAIEEIQDNNGTVDNGTVDASSTWGLLISAVQDAGGPVYAYRQIDPVNDEDGGAPGGNIRQGFLFRTDRGLSFVDHAGGDATSPTEVTSGAGGPELTLSPGRIDPNNAAFLDSRKPLAGEFLFRGRKLFVVANHFNSKGGDDPLFGHYQPPEFFSEIQRNQQAAVVNGFIDELLSVDPNANVVVLGDLNDFQFSSAIATLKGNPAVLNDLIDTLPENERYTYVYQGNSETLDHILFSNNLFERHAFAYDVVHVNSEFYDQSSDHEPQVVYISFNPPQVDQPAITPEPSTEGQTVTASASFLAPAPEDAPLTCKVDYGDGSGYLDGMVSGDYLSGYTCTGPQHAYAAFGSYTVTVSVSNSFNETGSNSATHTVVFNFDGFFKPVENLPTLNVVKAGVALPVKFSLGGDKGLKIFMSGYPRSEAIACDTSQPQNNVQETVTAGLSSLSYDPTTDQYVYVWKSEKSWANTCRTLTIRLVDGTTHSAKFSFK
jgi:predicted extracellular nuclease